MINVLIIEDEHAIRRFLRTALEADGMRVFEAETLQRGLIEAATRKPDLAILDLGLPDEDGLSLIRRWRSHDVSLPVLVLTFASLGGMTRYVRSAMIDALSMDYIRTARAKGLREKVVIYSHAWRNALLPVITVIISWFLSIFSGSVIVETTFTLNGMGQLYYQALRNSDYELALACQMFYCVVSLVGALIMDLSYGLVDPRVRVDK